ncbi:hypothetical protein F0562_007413 [Nyssa sinensis]|uniref:Uncharacterized protein n=1 Tax=Nyssa sinensis TaxID=561372 RepID=A0A5J5A6D2_9ASTE|nr:hypothetical protein F0562_007413 [Nyssa sinensis]
MIVLDEIRYESHDLESQLQLSDISIFETATFKAKIRYRSKIKVARVTAVEEKKDEILKLGRRLAYDGYNFCLKKMAKAYPKFDIEVLENIDFSEAESEEFKDNDDPEDSVAPTDL